VQRRELDERFELRDQRVVDDDRVAERLAAVDEPVRDELDGAGRLPVDRPRRIAVDQRQLEGGGARVDD
jgi:hypothetical protein